MPSSHPCTLVDFVHLISDVGTIAGVMCIRFYDQPMTQLFFSISRLWPDPCWISKCGFCNNPKWLMIGLSCRKSCGEEDLWVNLLGVAEAWPATSCRLIVVDVGDLPRRTSPDKWPLHSRDTYHGMATVCTRLTMYCYKASP